MPTHNILRNEKFDENDSLAFPLLCTDQLTTHCLRQVHK